MQTQNDATGSSLSRQTCRHLRQVSARVCPPLSRPGREPRGIQILRSSPPRPKYSSRCYSWVTSQIWDPKKMKKKTSGTYFFHNLPPRGPCKNNERTSTSLTMSGVTTALPMGTNEPWRMRAHSLTSSHGHSPLGLQELSLCLPPSTSILAQRDRSLPAGA